MFEVYNAQMFADLSHYRLTWSLESEGRKIVGGEVPPEAYEHTPPFGKSCFTLALPQIPGGLVTLTFRWLNKSKTLWVEAGYEQAFDQFMLKSDPAKQPEAPKGMLKFSRKKGALEIGGNGFAYRFEKGVLTSMKIRGSEYLDSPLKPNYYRALTDNDRELSNFVPFLLPFYNADSWRRGDKRQIGFMRAVDSPEGALIVAAWYHPFLKKAETQYLVRRPAPLKSITVQFPAGRRCCARGCSARSKQDLPKRNGSAEAPAKTIPTARPVRRSDATG